MVNSKNSVFVDANVFIALINKDDALHKRAVALRDKLRNEKASLLTSNFVVSEVITVLSLRVDKKKAVEFGELVYGKTKALGIIRPTPGIEERALAYLKAAKSKNISFVDCLTLAMVEFFGIKRLFSFDKDLRFGGRFELIN